MITSIIMMMMMMRWWRWDDDDETMMRWWRWDDDDEMMMRWWRDDDDDAVMMSTGMYSLYQPVLECVMMTMTMMMRWWCRHLLRNATASKLSTELDVKFKTTLHPVYTAETRGMRPSPITAAQSTALSPINIQFHTLLPTATKHKLCNLNTALTYWAAYINTDIIRNSLSTENLTGIIRVFN